MDTAKRRICWKRRTSLVVAVVGCAAMLAACGSSKSADGGGNSGHARGENTAAVGALLHQFASPNQTWHGPTSSPAPAAHKRIFILAVILASITKQNVSGIVQAAELMGWQTTVFNGEGNPSLYAQGLQEAVNGHYDGVIMSGVTPTVVKAQVAAVRRAGIPIVDTNDVTPPSATSADADVLPPVPIEGRILAAAVAKDSGGKANVLLMTDNESGISNAKQPLFISGLKSLCPGCQIAKQMPFTIASLGTPELTTMIQSALRANPSVNYVYAPYDDAATAAVQAIQSGGLSGKVKVVSVYGQPQNLSFVRQGIQDADIAIPNQWVGFSAVDTLNRIFHGATPSSLTSQVTASAPQLLVTHATVGVSGIPSGGSWSGGYNYVAKYEKLWGVK